MADLKEAQKIFKDDFIGIDEIEYFTGYKFTSKELDLINILWEENIIQKNLSVELLKKLKKQNFMIVLRGTKISVENKNKSISISSLIKKYPTLSNLTIDKTTLKNISKETLTLKWVMVSKENIKESIAKPWTKSDAVLKKWCKQNKMKFSDVEVRTPLEAFYDTLAYGQNRRKALFNNQGCTWTTNPSAMGLQIWVGNFDGKGLRIGADDKSCDADSFGLTPVI